MGCVDEMLRFLFMTKPSFQLFRVVGQGVRVDEIRSFVRDRPTLQLFGGMVRGCVLDEIPSFVHDRPTHPLCNELEIGGGCEC